MRALVLALTFATAAQAVRAQGPAPFDVPQPVLEQALHLVEQAALALAPPGARVSAKAGALDARLRLAPCARVEPHLVAGLSSWGATRVGLRCTSGAVAWRASLPVQVRVLAPAWTARATLPGGALVMADQWELAEIDWAASTAPPLGPASPIAGRSLARPVAAGQPLRESDLHARRWFSSGQTVRILAAGEGYSITTEGQALGHGIEGQPVRVRTEAGRLLTGQPVGESLVVVHL